MKKLSIIAGLFFAVTACTSSDNDSNTPPVIPQVITVDNHSYTFSATEGINNTINANELESSGNHYHQSQILLEGTSLNRKIKLSFTLYFKDDMNVAGNYTFYDSDENLETSFPEFIYPLNRAGMGILSGGHTEDLSGNFLESFANPSGIAKVIVNSPNNYTIQYNGNYKVYDNGGNYVRTISGLINVTGYATVIDW